MADQEYFFPDSSGTAQICAQIWQPEGRPRAILQIVHGINEYAGRYDTFARFLAGRGVAVAAHDHMGHGKSVAEGRRLGYFAPADGWMHSLNDIRNFTAQLHERWPDTPLFIMGHSMGSFMMRDSLIRFDDGFTGVILSGTGCNWQLLYTVGIALCGLTLKTKGPLAKSRLVRDMCFGGYSKIYADENNSAAWISRDPAVYQAYVADPWCRFMPSVEMFRQLFRGMRHMDAPKNYARIRRDIPLLLMSGDADPVGGFGKGVGKVYQRLQQAGCADVELLLYPGSRHEVLNDYDKEQAYGDILEWMEEKLAAAE